MAHFIGTKEQVVKLRPALQKAGILFTASKTVEDTYMIDTVGNYDHFDQVVEETLK